MVQLLGLGAFTSEAQVQSLVGELRYPKPCHMAIKKERKRSDNFHREVSLPGK